VAAGNEISLVLTHEGEVWYSGYSELNNAQAQNDEQRLAGAAGGQDAQIIEQVRQASHRGDSRVGSSGIQGSAQRQR